MALAEESERTRQLLAELPEHYRRVIELARVEGLPHREIAERMRISEPASRMLLTRALARLTALAERAG